MRFASYVPLSTSAGSALWISAIVRLPAPNWRTVALLFLLPLTARAHGTFHEMMDELQGDLDKRPKDTALIIRRAALQVEHEDWQAAMVDLELASRLGAEESGLVLLRGRALAAGKQWAQAKAALDDFIATHNNIALAFTERARVHRALGDSQASLNDYRSALKLTPQPEPDLIIEVADEMAKQDLGEDALAAINQGIVTMGNVPQLVLKALDLELAAKRYDDALKRIDVMSKLMPRPEPWVARRASVLAQAGRTEESIATWRELHAHIVALPNLERGSHAMCQLMDQALNAIASLTQVSSTPTPPTNSLTTRP